MGEADGAGEGVVLGALATVATWAAEGGALVAWRERPDLLRAARWAFWASSSVFPAILPPGWMQKSVR